MIKEYKKIIEMEAKEQTLPNGKVVKSLVWNQENLLKAVKAVKHFSEEGKNLYNFIESSIKTLDNAKEKFEQYKNIEIKEIAKKEFILVAGEEFIKKHNIKSNKINAKDIEKYNIIAPRK